MSPSSSETLYTTVILKSRLHLLHLNVTLPLSSEVVRSLADRSCPPPADITTRRPPLSTPERWHWPRLPLWRPAHVRQWPHGVGQCRHPPTYKPGPAALHHHTCSGHNGRPLWAGRHWCVTAWAEKINYWTFSVMSWITDPCWFWFCRFSGSKPCNGQLWVDSWRHQWSGNHTDHQQPQPDSSPRLGVLF